MTKIKPKHQTTISPILHNCAETINKRGLIILVSDLLDSPDEILSGLNHFRYKGHEVIVFHIIDPQELEFNYNKRIRFIDMETNEEIETEPWHIQKEYSNQINSFCKHMKNECGKNKIDYTQIITNQNLDLALTEYLTKRLRIGG